MFEATLQVSIFYVFVTILILTSVSFASLLPARVVQAESVNNLLIVVTSLIIIIILGYREWWVEEAFGDSIRYGFSYLQASSESVEFSKDIGFGVLIFVCRYFGLSVNGFFLICAALYVVPLAISVKKIDKKHSFLVFLFIICSMSFFTYGVNGIRNGISTSFLLLAYACGKVTLKTIIYCVIAVTFHVSALLSILCWVASKFVRQDKTILIIWLLAIPLSFLLKNSLAFLSQSFDFIESRASNYLSGDASLEVFSKVGFRYDFLLYSSIPLFVYFFYRNHLNVSPLFKQLFYTYTLSNSIWILINQVPFSNRFAYISWFLLPVVLVYPFLYNLKHKSSKLFIGLILILYNAFTLIIS